MATDPAEAQTGDPGDAGDESEVGTRIFLGLAAYFFFLGALYAVVSTDEYAGVVLLLLAGCLALLAGSYLAFGRRHGLRQELTREDYEDPDLYLPTTSTHPVVMGGGIILLAAGLALGIWVLLPGFLILGFGLYGFVQQGRART